MIVTVSRTNINYNGWIGCGYIITNPETGPGAYMISGGLSGALVMTFGDMFINFSAWGIARENIIQYWTNVYFKMTPINYSDPFDLSQYQWYMPPKGPPGSGCGDEEYDWITPDLYPDSCTAHDNCYATRGKTKVQCDNQFWRDMLIESGPSSNIMVPSIYWLGVILRGQDAYVKAQGSSQ
jgi:hypothetical protein